MHCGSLFPPLVSRRQAKIGDSGTPLYAGPLDRLTNNFVPDR